MKLVMLLPCSSRAIFRLTACSMASEHRAYKSAPVRLSGHRPEKVSRLNLGSTLNLLGNKFGSLHQFISITVVLLLIVWQRYFARSDWLLCGLDFP